MGKNQNKKDKLTKLEISWILYDVGNSAFTMLACALIPIWFKKLAMGNGNGQITSDQATAYWALIASAVTIITAILGPILGAFMDFKGKKKKFFVASVAIGAVTCLLTGFVTSWIMFAAVYVISRIAYSISLLVYDAMLGDVTTEDRLDVVSTYGFGWGYLGSCIPFLIALAAYIMGPDMLDIISNGLSMLIGFGITAIWRFVVTIH
ncbi:MFS transporter [Anaerostipes sp.]|uniref:MFS transporter n=1 Tax=Anaerostipes sp. TaxID=1872530 RepID=UPI0025848940|nr:MFS transporter [Anaerostipes sp.]MCI5622281.1 MFS transporter [Anaerostipes sp.]